MANFGRFNSSLFNAGVRTSQGAWLDDIIFNGFWLQNKHFITEKANPRDMPSISLLTYSNPKDDGGGLLDRFYKQRTITLRGHILGDSLQDTDYRIDTLKKALSVKEWYLDRKMGDGTYRRILCTLTNTNIIDREHYDREHGAYTLTFRAEQPFRQEKVRSSYNFSEITDEINEDIYNQGSEYSNPIINILVSGANNCNKVIVWIGETKIEIDHSLEEDDIIDINTDEKVVLLNNNSIDFNGRFPKLLAGVNTLNVQANGTFNFDVSVLFPKNYL